MQKTARELADFLAGELAGEAERLISGVNSLEEATDSDIAFAVPPYLETAAQAAAGVIIIPLGTEIPGKTVIRTADPRLAFSRLLALFVPQLSVCPGIQPGAQVAPDAVVSESAAIFPQATISEGASIGKNTILYPQVFIGARARIGKDCILYPGAVVRENCCLGDRVIVQPNAVIGSDGFGFVTKEGIHRKVPQVGNVVVGDDVEIGACATIDRATVGSTRIGRGTKIDNLVHLAHNVETGENCLFVAQTGIAGSTKIGHAVTFAGQTGSAGHITIGDGCVFAARSAPISDVPAGSFYSGFPARPHQQWLRTEAAAGKVPELLKRVKELEKRLAALEELPRETEAR